MNNRFVNGIAGTIAILLWLSAFLPGLTINSKEFRDALMAGQFSSYNVFMALLTYTLTNVAFLCCIAGIIGSCTKRLLAPQEEPPQTPDPEQGDPPGQKENNLNPMFSGVLRGFLIFLVVLAGAYASTSDPFTVTTADQYARMAGTVSLLSFVINYDPAFFETIIATVRPKPPAPQVPPPAPPAP